MLVMKKLDCGEVFEAANSFPSKELPFKKVIKSMLMLPNSRTLGASREVAQELHYRWVWSNVCPQHHYTIVSKMQETMTTCSKITRYPRKNSRPFMKMESSFLLDIENLFDVYWAEKQQRKQMEIRHSLVMARENYAFY